jgi:hypothetical protein
LTDNNNIISASAKYDTIVPLSINNSNSAEKPTKVVGFLLLIIFYHICKLLTFAKNE